LHRAGHILFACAVAAVASCSSAAAAERKTVRAHRVREAMEIDGRLDEAGWQAAIPVTDFVQQDPDEGEPISERTEVRVLYDETNLYISFRCWDAEPHRIVANEMRRDGELWQNDNVYVLLDTYGDRRQGYFFRTNPLGAQSDSAVTDDGRLINGDWDCVWESAGRVHDRGWDVELAIPFQQMRFRPRAEMEWGVNFGRNIARLNGAAQWVRVPATEGWPGTYRPTYTGRLVGLEGVRASAHLDVLPYVLAGGSEHHEEGRSHWSRRMERDMGLDVKYGITSNLTLDLTLNTDFAQVESDREEVNLTRFDLFFPEKRDFFLEGRGLFAFGAGEGDFGPPPLSLFYSRRIGIEEDRQVPILGGGKLTGKVGAYDVGALSVVTDKVPGSEATAFGVVRLRRDVMARSSVGVIATDRRVLHGAGYGRNGGVDVVLRPADQWELRGLAAGSWSHNDAQRGGAWYLANNWRNSTFRLDASYLDISPDFRAEMGYVQRSDIRSLRLDGGVELQPQSDRVRGANVGMEGTYLVNHAGELLGWRAEVRGGVGFHSGDGFGFGVRRELDNVAEPFEIGDAAIPAGLYEMMGAGIGGGTNESRPLAAFADIRFGQFYGGHETTLDVNSRWRVTHQWAVELRYGRNWLNLPADAFTTNVMGARVSYSHNTRLFSKVFAQWNDTRDRLSANLLVRYIYRPGSDLYVVYDHALDTSGGLRTRSWALLAKWTLLRSM
jgi:hypothetical protein